MKYLPTCVLLVSGLLTGTSHAVTTIFSDNFSNVTSGTVLLSARTATVGSWNVIDPGPTPPGPVVITGAAGGGYVETSGARRLINANFTSAIPAGSTLQVTWTTLDSTGNFFSGYSGISLLNTVGTTVGFFGSTTRADVLGWELAVNNATAGTLVTPNVLVEPATAVLTYNSLNGFTTLNVNGSVASITLAAGQVIDRLQFENNSGADARFTSLLAVVVPEPGRFLLLGIGACGLFTLRRRK